MKSTSQHPSEPRRLFRSETNKKLAGVCGGIGDYFNVDPTVVRVAWIILSFATGVIPGIIAYIAAALIMPNPPTYPQ